MKANLSSFIKSENLIVRYTPVLSHHSGYEWGARVKCEIGKWNFDGSCFVDYCQGKGVTEGEAYAAAEKDYYTPFVGNEDALGLGLMND